MQEGKKCRIVKIKSPFHFHIEQVNQNSLNNIIKLELKPTPNKQYFHLLNELFNKDLTYTFSKKNHPFIDQYKKGYLFLDGKDVTSLYKNTLKLQQSGQYLPQQIIQCFVMKIQCLKLILINLQNLKIVTFYFSQLKLPRPDNIHPKQSWQKAQKYFKEQLQGDFVQIKVNGNEKYRQQTNIFGQMLRIKNGDDIKEKFIMDGFAQISKNANKYLSQERINSCQKMVQTAKKNKTGIWKMSQKLNKKSTNQSQELKYKKWDQLLKDNKFHKSLNQTNIQAQMKQINFQMKKMTGSNIDLSKAKILISVVLLMFQNVDKRNTFKLLDDFIKIISQCYMQVQISIYQNIENIEYLKYYGKCLTMCIFYLDKISQMLDQKQKFPLSSQMQKILKTIFKTAYIGNDTFHEKNFGKKKQNNYDAFSFETAYLNGGISSYSEQSDYQQNQKNKMQNKINKRIGSAHLKIRINSTYLISLILKNYPMIVENYWQLCVRSNILTQDFFNYLKKVKITAQSTKMTQVQKGQVVNLVRTNFGDPSLILLTIFQKNSKVKINAINCILNMITNFQGKKMINTTQSFYIQKLLKETKSSFIPKSYIIFSGLKNALYFLLFSLNYEKNIQIINLTFKTLCELCNQCALIDKLQFEQGMGLLMANYINPVLQFPWNVVQLEQLKVVCISFLSVLVSTQKKWDQIESMYLLSSQQNNINAKLLSVLQNRKTKVWSQDKLFIQILKYFTKLSKKYFGSIFYSLKNNFSIWNYISKISLQKREPVFSKFIEQVCKCNFDQIKMDEQANKQTDLRRTSNYSTLLSQFLQKFIGFYCQSLEVDNYISLINILTYIDYEQWKNTQNNIIKEFLIHCFKSLSQDNLQGNFPCIDTIKNNSLVRISLIKMIGYMSFCPQFYKEWIIQSVAKLLIEYSKKYKSLNSIIKITWAISNWAKVKEFTQKLLDKQLQECLNYLIYNSQSDKQKIASNSTRGIGFFSKYIQKQNKLNDKCRKAVINNLNHQILKVRTNSTKTLKEISLKLNQLQIKQLVPVLQHNLLKNNFHLQTQTLLLIKALANPIKNSRLFSLYVTILKSLLNQVTLQYQFSQIKTIKQLRKIVLSQILNIPQQIKEQQSKDIFLSICSYLQDCEQESIKTQAKMLERGFEKSQQAQKMVFNIKNQKYDEQNIVSTETALKGFRFQAKQQDSQILKKIKAISMDSKFDLSSQWTQLKKLQIEGSSISIGNIYI